MNKYTKDGIVTYLNDIPYHFKRTSFYLKDGAYFTKVTLDLYRYPELDKRVEELQKTITNFVWQGGCRTEFEVFSPHESQLQLEPPT